MFSENKRKRYMRLLDLKEEELSLFLKRYNYYLKSKKELSPNIILNGFFILDDIRTKREKQKALRAKYKSRNKYIIKYRDEIIELYQQGLGFTRISKQLEVNHKIKISRSSLYRYIKINNIKRETDGQS
jgi:predicted transcriptional regulator YheO